MTDREATNKCTLDMKALQGEKNIKIHSAQDCVGAYRLFLFNCSLSKQLKDSLQLHLLIPDISLPILNLCKGPIKQNNCMHICE